MGENMLKCMINRLRHTCNAFTHMFKSLALSFIYKEQMHVHEANMLKREMKQNTDASWPLVQNVQACSWWEICVFENVSAPAACAYTEA